VRSTTKRRRKYLGLRKLQITEQWNNVQYEVLHVVYSSPVILTVLKQDNYEDRHMKHASVKRDIHTKFLIEQPHVKIHIRRIWNETMK
jgi:hypothetical protein